MSTKSNPKQPDRSNPANPGKQPGKNAQEHEGSGSTGGTGDYERFIRDQDPSSAADRDEEIKQNKGR